MDQPSLRSIVDWPTTSPWASPPPPFFLPMPSKLQEPTINPQAMITMPYRSLCNAILFIPVIFVNLFYVYLDSQRSDSKVILFLLFFKNRGYQILQNSQ